MYIFIYLKFHFGPCPIIHFHLTLSNQFKHFFFFFFYFRGHFCSLKAVMVEQFKLGNSPRKNNMAAIEEFGNFLYVLCSELLLHHHQLSLSSQIPNDNFHPNGIVCLSSASSNVFTRILFETTLGCSQGRSVTKASPFVCFQV